MNFLQALRLGARLPGRFDAPVDPRQIETRRYNTRRRFGEEAEADAGGDADERAGFGEDEHGQEGRNAEVLFERVGHLYPFKYVHAPAFQLALVLRGQ